MPSKTATAEPIVSPSRTLDGLAPALAKRIADALDDARVTAAGVQHRDEVYLAVRVASSRGADLLGHVRLVASADPSLGLPSVRNSIPTAHTVVALAKFEQVEDGAVAVIPADTAEACIAQGLAAIAEFAEVVEATETGALEPLAETPATEACRDAAAEAESHLTSGANAVEAATAAAEGVKATAKAKRPRKSRPKSKIAISRGERK